MPGTDVRRSSAARQTGEPLTVSLISRSSLASWASRVFNVALIMRWTRGSRLTEPVSLHADHLHHLAAARDQFGQGLAVGVGERAWFGTDPFGEQGDNLGIERIGRGKPAGGAGEITDLVWVDHGERKAPARQSSGQVISNLTVASRTIKAGAKSRKSFVSCSRPLPSRVTAKA